MLPTPASQMGWRTRYTKSRALNLSPPGAGAAPSRWHTDEVAVQKLAATARATALIERPCTGSWVPPEASSLHACYCLGPGDPTRGGRCRAPGGRYPGFRSAGFSSRARRGPEPGRASRGRMPLTGTSGPAKRRPARISSSPRNRLTGRAGIGVPWGGPTWRCAREAAARRRSSSLVRASCCIVSLEGPGSRGVRLPRSPLPLHATWICVYSQLTMPTLDDGVSAAPRPTVTVRASAPVELCWALHAGVKQEFREGHPVAARPVRRASRAPRARRDVLERRRLAGAWAFSSCSSWPIPPVSSSLSIWAGCSRNSTPWPPRPSRTCRWPRRARPTG